VERKEIKLPLEYVFFEAAETLQIDAEKEKN
jgi:hypothetical protein